MVKTALCGARILDPAHQIDDYVDLNIENQLIHSLKAGKFRAKKLIDLEGAFIFPGLIDLGVRLTEPGYEYKGSVASETQAAVNGGITTLCCLPDTLPVMDNPAVVQMVLEKASAAGFARVIPIGALTQGLAGQHLSEMYALKEAGCLAVTNARQKISSNRLLMQSMRYAKTHELCVFLTPLDHEIAADGCVNQGMASLHLGLPGISSTAETVALARDLLLIEETGVKAHFCRITCARSVHMLREAQARGLNVTADVAIHNLLLTDASIQHFDSRYHVQPPLRSEHDRQALLAGLRDETIQAIVSDHQPHEIAAKQRPFANSEPGIAGLETLLSLGMELVKSEELTLYELIRAMTVGPAKVLGMADRLGHLGAGAVGDICVYNPNWAWLASPDTCLTLGQNSPFYGKKFSGRVSMTFRAGRCVMERGDTDALSD